MPATLGCPHEQAVVNVADNLRRVQGADQLPLELPDVEGFADRESGL